MNAASPTGGPHVERTKPLQANRSLVILSHNNKTDLKPKQSLRWSLQCGRQTDGDTISPPPSAKRRGERCIPTAPYADISSDQRQLSPLCLNQRETLERAHRWPAPDKQHYTALLRWLQTWLWAESVYRIAHGGYNVVQNPPASLTEDAHNLFCFTRIHEHYRAMLWLKNLNCELSMVSDVK